MWVNDASSARGKQRENEGKSTKDGSFLLVIHPKQFWESGPDPFLSKKKGKKNIHFPPKKTQKTVKICQFWLKMYKIGFKFEDIHVFIQLSVYSRS